MFGLDNLMDMLFDSAMESLNRHERVIQLLKRLNLDPDHPPADFEAVYKYALVEYGVDKPRPALEIFRQAKIQELFREALERNNPSLLLKNGEDFLTDSPLQADLQASNVDVRREFYAFAAVFIEVAKRTRTPAEILAEQKLESLHRQIGGLQERLNRLPTIEGMRTEMARLAGQGYPALPGAAAGDEPFNAERCNAFALAQQIRGWFETLGYRFETHEVWEADYFEWIINVSVWRSRYIRILVRGVDGEVGLVDVNALRQSAETHKTDEGWIVTARRVARAAKDQVAQPENSHLGCYTLDELLDQDADFSGYLTWLETEIQKRGIDQKYVPLACLKEEIDPDTQQRIGVSRYGDRDGWIDGYIDLWLDDPAKEHISVLGEFGTGKTWFALHYAWKALQLYREAQRRGLERPRLPLVIPLRDYAKAVSVESLFSEFFFRKHEIPIPGYSAFEQLNRMGKLLLIFDGFDEMAARVDRQEMINNFWELAKVVVPGAKVILTCRTEHFPDAKEGRALLNAELQASTRDLTGETPQFEVLELEKFNDEQIRQVLDHQAQPATVEQIMGNPQLLDLARRPVLTELILEALPDIEAGKPVDMSRVYLYAVRHKMERDIKAERTFTSMADKLYFMCELSWEMLSTDRMSINYREFPDRIRKLFGPAVQEEKDLDHWHYDMMGQTMLIRNAEGYYSPAHRSMTEFFVAYKFAAELGLLSSDFTELAKSYFVPQGVIEQDLSWSAYFQKILKNQGKELNRFINEPIETLRTTVGEEPLTKAVLDLLLPMLDLNQAEENLLKLLKLIRHRGRDEVATLGGNLATILVNLNRNSLENQDLSHTVIRYADFSDAYLRNIDFTGTDLTGSKFLRVLGSVYSISVSPNGQIFATGDTSGSIRLWRLEDGSNFSTLNGHARALRSVAFSPDGRILASASEDSTIKFWDVQTGNCLRTCNKHTDWVFSVAFSPDGSVLASGGGDKRIILWDVLTGRSINTLEGHTKLVEPIAFSPNNQVLASGSGDSTIKIWDIRTGICLKTLEEHTDRIRCLAISPTDNILVSGSEDKLIKVWDLDSGKCLTSIEQHSRPVRSITYALDGSVFASAGEDKTIYIWQAQSGEHLKTLEGHDSWIRTIVFSPDSQTLISGGGERVIKIWNPQTGQCLKTFQGWMDEIRSVSFHPDGQNVAGGSRDGSLKIWNIWTGEMVVNLTGHSDKVYSVAFSNNGKMLVSGSRDESIRLWDVPQERLLGILKGHNSRVSSVVFSPDDTLIASSGYDGLVKLWDVQSSSLLKEFTSDTILFSADFSASGNSIAATGEDGIVRVWNIQDGKCLELKGHRGRARNAIFSPDGKLVISSGNDQKIKIWDSKLGKCLKNLEEHESWVDGLVITSDGETLISSSGDWTIKLWNVESGECLRTLAGHKSWVEYLTLSKDNQYVVSVSHDQTVKLWDIQAKKCINTLEYDKPYNGMNITSTIGLSDLAKATLKRLGAIEN